MYEEHPDIDHPLDEATLWRYMSFTKFVSLLDKSALFFARADKLSDPFEGSYSPVNVALRPTIYAEYADSTAVERRSTAMATLRNLRRFFLLNCWHQNDHESEAMWKLYSGERDGIAVRCTFQSLKQSLTSEESIYVGRVSYVDYKSTFIPERNAMSAYFHKRKSFEHENEVRAICMKLPEGGNTGRPVLDICDVGLYLDVDLSQLIEEVVVAPYAEDWFFELIESVASQYQLEAAVRRSSLAELPVWS